MIPFKNYIIFFYFGKNHKKSNKMLSSCVGGSLQSVKAATENIVKNIHFATNWKNISCFVSLGGSWNLNSDVCDIK